MKKLATALSAALALGAAASANAADATITFTGQIDATSCGVAVGGADAAGSAVTLRRVTKANVESGTNASRETPFTIVVGSATSKCPGTTSILKFSGGIDAAGRIENGAGATADNVAVTLVNSDDTELDLRTAELESTSLADGVYTHNVKARYTRVNASEEVTAGGFSGSVGIDLAFR
ncbi:fimbrial protein [Stenotrophomonas maltophilia group sp. P373]